MNSALPPGPFEYETTAPFDGNHGKGHVYIVDADGRKIATVWGPADTKMAMKDLIIAARDGADEMERLRTALKVVMEAIDSAQHRGDLPAKNWHWFREARSLVLQP